MLGTEDQKPGSSSAPDTVDVEQQEESGPPEDVDAEALELMGQGKRNLVVGDPPAAVQCFQEACELLASKYGETAEECGDAYYQYGCSLLELASMENGVLGNALQGVPEDSADSADSDDEGAEKPSGSTVESADKLEAKEREEVIQQVKDALEANCESEESEKEDKGKEGEEEEDKEEKMEEGGDNKEAEAAAEDEKDDKEELKKEKKDEEKKVGEKEVEEKEKESGEEKKDVEKKVEEKDEKKEEEKKDEEKSEKEVEKKDTVTEKADDADKTEKEEKKDDDDDDEEAGPSAEDDQKEDGDDISNFQLAWEMLELSRVIISKKEDEESQMKTSQIHLKLGELGLETEQYTQSIVDFKACLDIQKKYLDPESRLIAGTHYNLGLACSFAQQFDESIEHYRESKQLIEKRLASLEKKVSETEGKGKEKADENDPIVCAQKEMDELKELLPDVVSKLEDAKEMKLQAASSSSSAGAGPSSSTSAGFASSSSGFAPSSSSEPVQQIAVRKKRKPEESDAAADSKRSRQEENGEKPALNGSGDTKVVNGNGQMANGVMNGDMNGDSKHSPEKPAEIKTKKLAQDGEAPAAMETS